MFLIKTLQIEWDELQGWYPSIDEVLLRFSEVEFKKIILPYQSMYYQLNELYRIAVLLKNDFLNTLHKQNPGSYFNSSGTISYGDWQRYSLWCCPNRSVLDKTTANTNLGVWLEVRPFSNFCY